MPAVALAHVTKTYPGGVRALDDVSLTVERGTFLAVMGPSGSGKSTLMHCAAGLDIPTRGSAFIDGTDIGVLTETRRTELRRQRVGFVFQSYNLVPSLSIADNITLPLRLAGTAPDAASRRRLNEYRDRTPYPTSPHPTPPLPRARPVHADREDDRGRDEQRNADQ